MKNALSFHLIGLQMNLKRKYLVKSMFVIMILGKCPCLQESL